MSEPNYLRQAWAGRRAATSLHIEIAALELFRERGVDQVSVDDIAQAAGISRRTFYRYFQTADDVLSAMPRRSLRRLANDLLARPRHETLRQAFVGASRAAQLTDSERYVHQLCADVFAKDTAAWWRAIARMRPTTRDAYEQIVADRMRMCGEDTARAGLIGAVLHAVMDEVGKDFSQNGKFDANVDLLDHALDALVEIFGR